MSAPLDLTSEIAGYLSHSAKVVRARIGVLRARTTPEAIRDILALIENAELAADTLGSPMSCAWTFSNDEWEIWETACGNSWHFEEGDPAHNHFKWCGFCGKPLVEKKA